MISAQKNYDEANHQTHPWLTSFGSKLAIEDEDLFFYIYISLLGSLDSALLFITVFSIL